MLQLQLQVALLEPLLLVDAWGLLCRRYSRQPTMFPALMWTGLVSQRRLLLQTFVLAAVAVRDLRPPMQ